MWCLVVRRAADYVVARDAGPLRVELGHPKVHILVVKLRRSSVAAVVHPLQAVDVLQELGRQQKIDTVPDVKAHLEKEMARPTKTLRRRGGKGIYRRRSHHTPLRVIPRRLPAACTIPGSKKIHQFISVGVPGLLLWRRRPCHQSPGCIELDPARIIRECKHNDRCGRAKYVKVKVKSASSTVVTRSAAKVH